MPPKGFYLEQAKIYLWDGGYRSTNILGTVNDDIDDTILVIISQPHIGNKYKKVGYMRYDQNGNLLELDLHQLIHRRDI